MGLKICQCPYNTILLINKQDMSTHGETPGLMKHYQEDL